MFNGYEDEPAPDFVDEDGTFALMSSDLMGGAPLPLMSARQRQQYIDGIAIKAKYVGSLEVARPSGDAQTNAAIARVRDAHKSQGEAKPRRWLVMSVSGLQVKDFDTKVLLDSYPLHYISYTTTLASNPKVFAFISVANSTGEPVYTCHVYKSHSKARLITNTLGICFTLALDMQRAGQLQAQPIRLWTFEETVNALKERVNEASLQPDLVYFLNEGLKRLQQLHRDQRRALMNARQQQQQQQQQQPQQLGQGHHHTGALGTNPTIFQSTPIRGDVPNDPFRAQRPAPGTAMGANRTAHSNDINIHRASHSKPHPASVFNTSYQDGALTHAPQPTPQVTKPAGVVPTRGSLQSSSHPPSQLRARRTSSALSERQYQTLSQQRQLGRRPSEEQKMYTVPSNYGRGLQLPENPYGMESSTDTDSRRGSSIMPMDGSANLSSSVMFNPALGHSLTSPPVDADTPQATMLRQEKGQSQPLEARDSSQVLSPTNPFANDPSNPFATVAPRQLSPVQTAASSVITGNKGDSEARGSVASEDIQQQQQQQQQQQRRRPSQVHYKGRKINKRGPDLWEEYS